MDAVLNLVPEEARIQYSAMTGQSLYYMGEMDLKHKILAVVEEEGASRAAYALKLLQSEGSLAIASAGKDAATGKLVTHEYRVEGPVMLFLTTTAPDVDEELLNRCLVLSVNEDRSQTQAIHRLQREQQTLEGLIGRAERQRIVRMHRNAQRLLKPVTVVNPYAKELTFPRQHDAEPERSDEVSDADPRHCPAPSIPAARARDHARGENHRLHRSHHRGHRRGEPAGGGNPRPLAR
jgi:hypothetical protein